MQAHLYFICPTDFLEPVINRSFKQINYYYTSLGNSIAFDSKTIHYLKDLIGKYHIKEISLVLSENNPIARDALTKKSYSKILDLDGLYNEIIVQKRYSDRIWQNYNCPYLILSHYLNKKIGELRFHLDNISGNQLEIHGKIYSEKENVFKDIYSNLICIDYFSLN